MENKTFDHLWEDFKIANPNTVGVLRDQYESFKWLYNRLKVTEDTSEHHKSDNVHKNFNNTKNDYGTTKNKN